MVALATDQDVSDALGRPLTTAEMSVVSNLLETASDLVNGYLGWTVPDPVPGPVTRVVADVIAAVLLKPEVTTAGYDASGYNQIRGAATVRVGVESATTSGPWLSRSQKLRLAAYRSGRVTVEMVSDRAVTDGGSS